MRRLLLRTSLRSSKTIKPVTKIGAMAYKSSAWLLTLALSSASLLAQDPASTDEPQAMLEAVRAAEAERIAAIDRVAGSVVAIYDLGRQGGGSGVIIHPSGIALTNHHVIMGAGVAGWGGLADGNLYRWRLIGTDPGGDLAIIQLEGRTDFPHSPLGDSSEVRVGDFAMAMGNPFLLAEDQTPTVTLGIVSGVQRYQYGAGKNELVYGNCIQVDSSINPGNSGGPLFDMQGRVIGINGRGSFAQRGRVNVGLGYAISSHQIRNFIPDLLATKLTEHGSLDAQFGMRREGVVCEKLNLDSAAARAGLKLGDRLVRFQGLPIETANQFTNLISTMPEDWPVTLEVVDATGAEKTIRLRLLGLPYQTPPEPEIPEDAPEEQRQAMERQLALVRLLRQPPGTATDLAINQAMAGQIFAQSQQKFREQLDASLGSLTSLSLSMKSSSGAELLFQFPEAAGFEISRSLNDRVSRAGSDGESYWSEPEGERRTESKVAARNHAESLFADTLRMFVMGPRDGSIIELDGGDLAGGSNCYRLKIVESDGEWWYAWIRCENDSLGQAYDLVKTAIDRDGDPLAIRWMNSTAPLSEIRVVRGLGEEEREVWSNVAGSSPSANDVAAADESSIPSPLDPVQVNPLFEQAIRHAWGRTVKVYGASAGNVEGYGTGMIVGPDGTILTGTGIYLSGRTIRVAIPGHGVVNATLVKQDRQLQLALLKADVQTPEFFDLNEVSTAQRGDWIVSISNAFKVADGDEPLSVNLGVISLATQLEAMRNRRDIAFSGELILIDAITSNPGAAGGVVLDLEGRTVGMIGRVIESGDTNTRLNYAVPAESLRRFVAGETEQVAVENPNPNDATGSDPTMPKVPGDLGIRLLRLGGSAVRDPAYIDRVLPGSAAAEAGLRSDDLIVSLDGEKISNVAEFNERAMKLLAGTEAVVVVKRGDELLRFILIPKERQP